MFDIIFSHLERFQTQHLTLDIISSLEQKQVTGSSLYGSLPGSSFVNGNFLTRSALRAHLWPIVIKPKIFIWSTFQQFH